LFRISDQKYSDSPGALNAISFHAGALQSASGWTGRVQSSTDWQKAEPLRPTMRKASPRTRVSSSDNVFGTLEYNMDPEAPDNYSTTTMEHRAALDSQPVERLLWNAYFSQAQTEAEKQALLRKVQEKYKITVIDPDFFEGQTSP
jgi:hypothetical protein